MALEVEELVERLVVEVALTGTYGFKTRHLPERIRTLHKVHQDSASAGLNNTLHDDHGNLETDATLLENVAPSLENVWQRLETHADIDSKISRRRQEQEIAVLTETSANDEEPILRQDAATAKADSSRPTRIFATEKRMWLELTGHEVDKQRVPLFEFESLSVVGAFGAAGVQQGRVRDITGQQKQSLPGRTDSLARKGLILKTPICVFHTESSLLRLTRLVNATENESFSDAKRPVTFFDDRHRLVADVAALGEQAMTLLKQQPGQIMALRDLGHALGFYQNNFDGTTVLLRSLRRFVDAGCMQRVMAKVASGQGSDDEGEGFIRCVKLLRGFAQGEKSLLLNPRLNTTVKPKKPRNHRRINYDDLDESEEEMASGSESADEETSMPTGQTPPRTRSKQTQRRELQLQQTPSRSRGQTSTTLRTDAQLTPHFAPNVPLPSLLFRHIETAGLTGITLPSLRAKISGIMSDQAIDQTLIALIGQTHGSQNRVVQIPDETQSTDHGPRYRTYKSEQDDRAQVEEEDDVTAEAMVDRWGFTTTERGQYVDNHGRARLNEGRPAAGGGDARNTTNSILSPGSGGTEKEPYGAHLPDVSQLRAPKAIIRPRMTSQKDQEVFELWAARTAKGLARSAAAGTSRTDKLTKDVSAGGTHHGTVSEEPQTAFAECTSRIEAELLSRTRPGLYVNPPGAKETKAQFYVQRGRPRIALIAVVKSEKLHDLPWFEDDFAARNAPPALRRRTRQLISMPTVAVDGNGKKASNTADKGEGSGRGQLSDDVESSGGAVEVQSAQQPLAALSRPDQGTAASSLASQDQSGLAMATTVTTPPTQLAVADTSDTTTYSKDYILAHPDEAFHHAGGGFYKRGPRRRDREDEQSAVTTSSDFVNGENERIKTASEVGLPPAQATHTTSNENETIAPAQETTTPDTNATFDKSYVNAHPEEAFYHTGHGRWRRGVKASKARHGYRATSTNISPTIPEQPAASVDIGMQGAVVLVNNAAESGETLPAAREPHEHTNPTNMQQMPTSVDQLTIPSTAEIGRSTDLLTPSKLAATFSKAYVQAHKDEAFYHTGKGRWRKGLRPSKATSSEQMHCGSSLVPPVAVPEQPTVPKLPEALSITHNELEATSTTKTDDRGTMAVGAGTQAPLSVESPVHAPQDEVPSIAGSPLLTHKAATFDNAHVMVHPEDSFYHVGNARYRHGVRAPKDAAPKESLQSLAVPPTPAPSEPLPVLVDGDKHQKSPDLQERSVVEDANAALSGVPEATSVSRTSLVPEHIRTTKASSILHDQPTVEGSMTLVSDAPGTTFMQHEQSFHSAVPEPIASPKLFKRKGTTVAKFDVLRTPIGSSRTAARRVELIMHFVTACGGVYPGNKEIWYPVASAWQVITETTPQRSIVDRTVKSLLDAGKLRKVTFSFRSKTGTNEMCAVLALPGVEPSSTVVSDMKDAIIEAFPELHFPDGAAVSDKYLSQARQKPKRRRTDDGNVTHDHIAAADDSEAEWRPKANEEVTGTQSRVRSITPTITSVANPSSRIERASLGHDSQQTIRMPLMANASIDQAVEAQRNHFLFDKPQSVGPQANLHISSPETSPPTTQAVNSTTAEPLSTKPVAGFLPGHTRLVGTAPAIDDLEGFAVIPGLIVHRTEQGMKLPAFELAPDRPQSHRRSRKRKTMQNNILLRRQEEPTTNTRLTPDTRPIIRAPVLRTQRERNGRQHTLFVVLSLPPSILNMIESGITSSEWLRLTPGAFFQEPSGTFGTRSYWPSSSIVPRTKVRKRKRRRSNTAILDESWTEEHDDLSAGVVMDTFTYDKDYVVAHREDKFKHVGNGRYKKLITDCASGERWANEEDTQYVDDLVPTRDDELSEHGRPSKYRKTNSLHHIGNSSAADLVDYSMPSAEPLPLSPQHTAPQQDWLVDAIRQAESRIPTSVSTFSAPEFTAASPYPVMPPAVPIAPASPASEQPQISRAGRPLYKSRKRQADVGLVEIDGYIGKDADYGSPRKKQKTVHNVDVAASTVDLEELVVALALVKTLCSGLDQKTIPWDVVSHALEYRYDVTALKARWQGQKKARADDVLSMQDALRNVLLAAYEQDTLPRIDFQNLSSTDWPALMQWIKNEVKPSTATISTKPSTNRLPNFDLPATSDDMRTRFEVQQPTTKHGPYVESYFDSATDMQRTVTALHLAHGTSISQTPENSVSATTLSVMKTWCRAVSATPEAVYDARAANHKLSTFPEPLMKQALNELLADQILCAEKKGRQLPGRNFHLDRSVYKHLARWPGRDTTYLRNVAAARHRIMSSLAQADTLQLSYHADDFDVVVLTNMVALGQLKVVSVLPPLNNDLDAPFPRLSIWGIDEPNTLYNSHATKAERLRFPIEYHKTPAFTFEHGLKSVPIPLQPPSTPQGPDVRLPLWVDIHGNLIDALWDAVLRSILHLVVFRPGTTAKAMEKAHDGKLGAWEIDMLLQWMEKTGLAVSFGPGKEENGIWQGGWRANDFWYCAFTPEIATWQPPRGA